MRDLPVLNPYFTQRYGFSNQTTYKGLDQFEPRVSFEYKPVGSRLKMRGGVGIFGGGSPDIYLSNSFSNTITTNTLFIGRAARLKPAVLGLADEGVPLPVVAVADAHRVDVGIVHQYFWPVTDAPDRIAHLIEAHFVETQVAHLGLDALAHRPDERIH
jgi:hypothetical protein